MKPAYTIIKDENEIIVFSKENEQFTDADKKDLWDKHNILYIDDIAAVWVETKQDEYTNDKGERVKGSRNIIHLMSEDDGKLFCNRKQGTHFHEKWLGNYINALRVTRRKLKDKKQAINQQSKKRESLLQWLKQNNKQVLMSSIVKTESFIFWYNRLSEVGNTQDDIDVATAEDANFFINTHTSEELSELASGYCSLSDEEKHSTIERIRDFSNRYKDTSETINIDNIYFVVDKLEYERLSLANIKTLQELTLHAHANQLTNPVFITIDEDEKLLVN